MIKNGSIISSIIRNNRKIIAIWKNKQKIYSGIVIPEEPATEEEIEIIVTETEIIETQDGTAAISIPDDVTVAFTKTDTGELVVDETYSNIDFRVVDVDNHKELEMVTDGSI